MKNNKNWIIKQNTYDSFQLKTSFLKDNFIKNKMFVVKEEVQKKFKVSKIKKERNCK